MGLIGLIPFLILFAGLGFTRLRVQWVTGIVFLVAFFLALAVWHTSPALLGAACLEGFITAVVPIIWVIFAAVLSYAVSVETGGMNVIQRFLASVTPELPIQAVLIAFCLGGFLEAVAGFGTAVAIPTAMLISIGLRPVPAAVMSLVANSVPVAFGALGIPVIALAQVTALDVNALTHRIALQLLPFSILVPVVVAAIANGSFRGLKRFLPDVILIGVIFSAVQTATAFLAGPELVAVTGSLFSILGYVLVRGRKNTASFDVPRGKALFLATLNYSILLVLVLGTRLVHLDFLTRPPFTYALGVVGHTAKVDPWTTPGTLLLLATLIGGLAQGLPLRSFFRLGGETLWKIKMTALAIVFILMLAKVMSVSGMIASTAQTIASVSGPLFPFISPILGALGTFVTGSDTSSNILLGDLQKQTALSAGFDPLWVSAANTAGATGGKMISPQSISVATAVLGIESEGREILRRTFVYCLLYVFPLGLLVLGVAWALR